MAFRMIQIKDSPLPMGKVWFLNSLGGGFKHDFSLPLIGDMIQVKLLTAFRCCKDLDAMSRLRKLLAKATSVLFLATWNCHSNDGGSNGRALNHLDDNIHRFP